MRSSTLIAEAPTSVTKTKPKDVSETDVSPPILMPKTLEPNVETEGPVNELQLSESAISPNDDGVADSTTFHFKVRANDKWRLTLRDAYTEQIWEKSGTGSPAEGVVWNGLGSDNKLVPDGDYVAQLHIIDEKGTLHLRNSEKVTVDLIPATVEISKKTPASVGIKTWDINLIANWKLEIFDVGNKSVEKSEGRGAPPETIVLTKVPQLAPSTYKFALTVKDIAGNQSVQQAQLQFGSGTGNGTQEVSVTPKLTLMVGSFAEQRNANMLAENLRRLYPNEKVKIYTATVNERTLYRVTIGEFAVRSDASELKQQVQESQGVEPILITPQ